MRKLDGHHALVTGGGRGIGAAIARVLDAAGAKVSLLGRDRSRLLDVLSGLDNPGAAVSADVADMAAVEAALATVAGEAGPLSILVNNAGAAESAPFAKTDAAVWARMLDVNLTGVFNCCHAALPDLLQREGARIINVASTAGLKGYGYVSAYCAAKHGVVGLTRALAVELASKPITVNAVCPGFTETDLLQGSLDKIMASTGMDEAAARKALAKENPQGRFITPEEVADAVLWLCGAEAASITGQALPVAGGEVM